MGKTAAIALLAWLAVGGCAEQGKLTIRQVGAPPAGAGLPISGAVALAAGQLATGNVALALEGFRRAAREDPTSAAALAGMAQCYESMGRLDLTRRYYEQALALAPDEPALYLALSGALERQGSLAEATSLRNELAARIAGKQAPVVAESGSVAQLPVVVAEAPVPARPVVAAASVTVELPPARPAGARLERLSSGEVALVTGTAVHWARPAELRRTAMATVRARPFVVLNAAQVEGIAARTRDYLAGRGFAGATIGTASKPVALTVVRYPEFDAARARRIAAQFPFAARLEVAQGPLTLVIGRDAARGPGRRG